MPKSRWLFDSQKMKKIAASQAILASSVFLDIVDFSKLPTSLQVVAKNRFNTILQAGLATLGEDNYWVRDQGDGALIVCQRSPEHAFFLALKIQDAFSSADDNADTPNLALRIGLHLGGLKSHPDVEGRPNFLGDGINATQRIMDFAHPGQILASRAFVEAVARLHSDYGNIFQAPQSLADKHGRSHDVYAVEASPQTLARLSEDIAASTSTQTKSPEKITALAHPSLVDHAANIVRQWFAPFNALIFSTGALWAGFQRFGFSDRQAQLFGVSLAILGIIVWLSFRRRARIDTPSSVARALPAIGLVIAAVGTMVIATAWFSTISSEPAQANQTEVHATLPAPSAMPADSKPASLPAAPPVKAEAKEIAAERKVSAPKPVAQVTPSSIPAHNRDRCAALLNRSALGEPISAAEKEELIHSCR